MLFLIFSILCSALIGNLLILFDRDEKSDIFLIFLGNYFLASLFSLSGVKTPFSEITGLDLTLGIATGFLFLVNFLIYRRNIQFNGLSLSVSTMRVSLLIPTFISLWLYGDRIGFSNYLGIFIIVSAFIFVTEFKSFHNLLFLVLLFIITGFSDTSLKVYDEAGAGHENLFVFVLFFSAFVFNLIWIIFKKKKLIWKYFGYGMILGIPNQLTTKLFLRSLTSVPAPIAYPLFASSVVLICVLADLFLWKKNYTLKQKLGYAIMVAGIVLLNLR